MKITDVETILLCYRYEQDEKWKWSGVLHSKEIVC